MKHKHNVNDDDDDEDDDEDQPGFNAFTIRSMWAHSSIKSKRVSNRRFPERKKTGKDNLTVFSYSGRVKSPEWRRQLRRADLRQF